MLIHPMPDPIAFHMGQMAIQDANLARAIKERAQAGDANVSKLISAGSTAQMLDWLQKNPQGLASTQEAKRNTR